MLARGGSAASWTTEHSILPVGPAHLPLPRLVVVRLVQLLLRDLQPWLQLPWVQGLRHLLRGTSLIRNNPSLGPYSRTISRVLGGSWGNGLFLISKVPLYILRVFDAYMVGPWTLGHCP